MKVHPRVESVNRAAIEMSEALSEAYPAGSVIEDACLAVAICEINSLFYSKHGEQPITFRLPPDERVAGLWEKIHAIQRAHELTWGEVARAVHHLSNSHLNWIVRVERHGDDEDARADLA